MAILLICVMGKPKQCKQTQNVCVNDRGFSGKTELYEHLLHNFKGGPILHKLKHPPLSLNVVDPQFVCTYDEAKHGKHMRCDLNSSHLEPKVQDQICALVKKYWSIFDNKGVFVPVKNYKCVIDTGDAPPVTVKKILYGSKETPIMWNAIDALAQVGKICQTIDSRWLFKALLASKPHQEHVLHINNFVWCLNMIYVPLHSVTQIIAYQILHCDLVINEEFGLASCTGYLTPPWGITN
jgi:hypothetical protein